MQKIIPHLWFNNNAEEAATFYASVFTNTKIGSITRYTEAGHEVHGMEAGTAMTVNFQIEGYTMIALNGGPMFTFTPAISFMVNCTKEEEVNDLFEQLSKEGEVLMPLQEYPFSKRYAWVNDAYGVSWQLIMQPNIQERSITPSFLFTGDVAGKAEEAMKLYTSLFEGEIKTMIKHGKEHQGEKENSVMYGDFTLAGKSFVAMDSAQAHAFTFNEAVSLLVTCKDQAEIDHLWNSLSSSPEAEQCGWLKDMYGVSWQIVPSGMEKIFSNKDKEVTGKAMNAVMGMKKFDIKTLEDIIGEPL